MWAARHVSPLVLVYVHLLFDAFARPGARESAPAGTAGGRGGGACGVGGCLSAEGSSSTIVCEIRVDLRLKMLDGAQEV